MKMRKWHSTVQQKVCQHQASAGQEFLTTETRGPTREGSCPGPILFTIYTSEPFHIAEKHLPSVLAMLTIRSCMWRSARSNVPGDDEIALSAMDDCIKELRDLMNRNESQPNVDKP